MTEKINPCPFCGRKALTSVYINQSLFFNKVRFKVFCSECEVNLCLDLHCPFDFEDADRAKQKVIEAWNRRADRGEGV